MRLNAYHEAFRRQLKPRQWALDFQETNSRGIICRKPIGKKTSFGIIENKNLRSRVVGWKMNLIVYRNSKFEIFYRMPRDGLCTESIKSYTE